MAFPYRRISRLVDLTIPEHAYLFGFIQCDGSLYKAKTGNKGKLSIELKASDHDVLYKLKRIIPVNSSIRYRTRNTNFKSDSTTAILTVSDLGFRTSINKLGVPYGKKSADIAAPSVDYCVPDYVRGLYDADGSLGYTAKGQPFISFTTQSGYLALYMSGVIFDVVGKIRYLTRNKRDRVYDVALFNDDAKKFVEYLYYPGCLSLERKYAAALQVLTWTRPQNMRRSFVPKRWDARSDDYIMTHSIEESMRKLRRTKQSILCRKVRLTKLKPLINLKG